jgi:hypothetical protein
MVADRSASFEPADRVEHRPIKRAACRDNGKKATMHNHPAAEKSRWADVMSKEFSWL